MNPTILESVRQKMSSKSNTELLDIWIDNNTAVWSPETFEAVKQILTSRGVPLPYQKTPGVAVVPPPAVRQLTEDQRFWMGLLKPVLVIGVVVGAADVLNAAAWLIAGIVTTLYGSSTIFPGGLWSALYAGFPGLAGILLIYGVWCAWRLQGRGRLWLIYYAWIALMLAFITRGYYLYLMFDWGVGTILWVCMENVCSIVHAAIFPSILLLLIHRREVRDLFIEPPRGFEPMMPVDKAAGNT